MHLLSALSILNATAAVKPPSGALSEVSHAAGGPSSFCDTQVQQYSGYFNLSTGDKHLFYWFFSSRSMIETGTSAYMVR